MGGDSEPVLSDLPVQRVGSWLLCHALHDTGALGVPAEYFHRGDEEFWRARWGVTGEDGFLQALRERPATGNAVWGSKMMWNYFGDALARLGAWPRLGLAPGAADPEVLAAAFPGLRFDRDAIGRLVRFAGQCEDGWRGWFAAHSIVPFEILYEDMAGGLTGVVRELAAFLGVSLPPGLGPVRPQLRRQADRCTERLIERFNSPARCSATGLVAGDTGAAAEDAEGLSFHRNAGRRL